MSFEFEVDSLDYGRIEQGITNKLGIGYINSSNFPIEFSDGSSGTYSLFAANGSAKIYLSIYKNNAGKFTVSCLTKELKKK